MTDVETREPAAAPQAGRLRKGWRPWRSALVAVIIVLGLPAVGIGGWVAWLHSFGNLHVVEAGRLYRSAQLDGRDLRSVIAADGIRSIINLRGSEGNAPWYREEIATSSAAGVQHFDFPMSAEAEPDPATLARLVSLLREAPEPILVHCKDGADRSGLAAALFELFVMHRPLAEAQSQLSFYYGHFPWLGSPTAAMDETLQAVAAGGGELGRAATGGSP